MLEGKTNEDIYVFIKENNLDKDFKVPVTKRTITNVRWQMKSEGYLNEDGKPLNKEDRDDKIASIKKENNENKDNEADSKKTNGDNEDPNKENEDPNKDSKKKTKIQRRQDWDQLSLEQVNKIADPQMRQKILDYKTFWEKARARHSSSLRVSLRARRIYVTKLDKSGYKKYIVRTLLESVAKDFPEVTKEVLKSFLK